MCWWIVVLAALCLLVSACFGEGALTLQAARVLAGAFRETQESPQPLQVPAAAKRPYISPLTKKKQWRRGRNGVALPVGNCWMKHMRSTMSWRCFAAEGAMRLICKRCTDLATWQSLRWMRRRSSRTTSVAGAVAEPETANKLLRGCGDTVMAPRRAHLS